MHVRHTSRGCFILTVRVPLSKILAFIMACDIPDNERIIRLRKHLIWVIPREVLKRINLNALALVYEQVNAHREEIIGFCPASLTSGHLFTDQSVRNEAFPITKISTCSHGFQERRPFFKGRRPLTGWCSCVHCRHLRMPQGRLQTLGFLWKPCVSGWKVVCVPCRQKVPLWKVSSG